MACEILISRACALAFGEIVRAEDAGHSWTRMTTLASWITNGGRAAEWPGDFYLVKVTDMDRADAQAMRYTHHLWRLQGDLVAMATLALTGEVEMTSAKLRTHLREKSAGRRAALKPALRDTTGEAEPFTRRTNFRVGRRGGR